MMALAPWAVFQMQMLREVNHMPKMPEHPEKQDAQQRNGADFMFHASILLMVT
jgi:hypothetical protein